METITKTSQPKIKQSCINIILLVRNLCTNKQQTMGSDHENTSLCGDYYPMCDNVNPQLKVFVIV